MERGKWKIFKICPLHFDDLFIFVWKSENLISAKCSPYMYGAPYIFYFVHPIVKTVKMMVQRADFEQNLKNICPATVKEKTRGKYCVLFYQFAIICRLLIMILISNHLQKKLLILGICFPSISINVIWSAISCILSTFVTVRLALVFAAALEKEYFFSNRRLCFLYREFFHRYEMNSLWFFFIIETRLKIPFIVRIGRLTVCPQNRLLGWGDQSGEKTSAYIIKENSFQD